MKFTSLNAAHKHFNSPKGQHLAILKSGKSVQEVLTECAEELEDYLIEGLLNYYSENKPSDSYERTYKTLDDLKVLAPESLGNGKWSIKINMESPHESWIGGVDGNTLTLLDTGWDKITYRNGTNYIDHAIEKFNTNNKYGVKVQMYRKYPK